MVETRAPSVGKKHISLELSGDMHSQVVVAAAEEQQKTGKRVSVSEFVRSAIFEKLAKAQKHNV